jgi:uncharacterized protein YndB with AHSA1/START domain
MKEQIKVEAFINAPIEKVWEYWNEPEHITKWCSASDDWHAPSATNDLKVGGTFTTRMEAKDGSAGFDFGGIYTTVTEKERIEYTMDDGRKVSIDFVSQDGGVKIVESFDPEDENPLEMQRAGWQAILDNFKRYTESN